MIKDMKTSNVRWKTIGIIAGILAIIAAVIFLIIAYATPAENPQNTLTASTTITTVANGTPGGSSTASAPRPLLPGLHNAPTLPGSTITIHLVTPISNNV